MRMTRDQLEYAISQYIDGTLPPLEQAALERRLETDPEARELLDEYRKLNAALKRAMPAPQLRWQQLAEHISQAVAEQELPVRHHSIASIGWMGRLAVAAALLLVISLMMHIAWRSEVSRPPQGIAIVSGPQVETPSGPVVAEISIGPSPTLAAGWRLGQEVVGRATLVLIDRAAPPAQDIDVSLY